MEPQTTNFSHSTVAKIITIIFLIGGTYQGLTQESQPIPVLPTDQIIDGYEITQCYDARTCTLIEYACAEDEEGFVEDWVGCSCGCRRPINQSDAKDLSANLPPPEVERLCANRNEREFVDPNGQRHVFRREPGVIRFCPAESGIWSVSEDGSKFPYSATFYFNNKGQLLDICQPLFWRSGCVAFGSLQCGEAYYCPLQS